MDGVSGASATAFLVILGGKLAIQVYRRQGQGCTYKTKKHTHRSQLRSRHLWKNSNRPRRTRKHWAFSLQNARDEFDFVVEMFRELFKDLSKLIDKYNKLDRNWWQKGKWASVDLDEGTRKVLCDSQGKLEP